MTHVPRTSSNRAKLGIRHEWLQDWRCRRYGHQPNQSVTQGQISGAYWPICDRCGYAVEPIDNCS